MNLLLVASLLLAFFFGLLAVALSIKEERTRKELTEQDKLQKQKILQISILKEIQDRIGYSLDVEEVIDVITGSLKHIFPYSTASSMVIKQDKIVLKTYVEEAVARKFMEEVKQSMLASLNALLPLLPAKIEEKISGVPLDDSNNSSASSFFHIPLVVNNQVVGLINISSTKPNLYREDEMTILYQIAGQASNALTRLREVLDTEKGKLTSMIASLSDGVFMLDNEKNILIINDSAKRFLRLKSNPAFFEILDSFPKEYDLVSRIEKVVLTKLPTGDIEVKIGESIFQTFITPVISSPNNKVIGVSFLLHDITLEKSLSEMKEDFTNMMVHELRAPLTNIKDASSLILDGGKLSEEEKEQFMGMVHSQAKILLTQVSDLLDASKIEAGKFVINKSQNDLGKIIQDVIKTFLPQAEKKQVNLSSKISPLPAIDVDSLRITQVLNNLVSNSLKFTPIGGQIRIQAALKGNFFIEVSVSDTGSGIPKALQKDLFSKFYQVTKTSNSMQGSGLGLYLVKGVVTAHNGSVSLESEEGKGTTIIFTLPVTQNYPRNYANLN
ncbi:MAG TPA: ATP-binding protein [Patescibacteria group bacterium]|nr:ATP-binding protein [Patescibacteria group bacterium]